MQYAYRCVADKPRLIILSSWLQENADPDQSLHQIQKVMPYAETQHHSRRGFILINVLPVIRVEQAEKLLELLTSQSGVTKLAVGLCDEDLVIHPRMSSTIIRNVHDLVSPIETNSELVQRRDHRRLRR